MFFSPSGPVPSSQALQLDDASARRQAQTDGRTPTQEPEPSSGAELSEFDPGPEPSASQVTMVEVTLLGDLVRILDDVRAQQRLRLEEERLANTHRAALVRAQEEVARHQAALAEHQKVATATAIRGELRIYNSVSSHWEPLPLMNGDPLPADVQFPADVWQLEGMAEPAIRRLAELYGVGDEGSSLENARDNLSLFLTGKRAP